MNRVTVGVGVLCLAIGAAAGSLATRALAPKESPPACFSFPSRQRGDTHEVLLDGVWRRRVETPQATLVETVPATERAPRRQVASLYSDGTVTITEQPGR